MSANTEKTSEVLNDLVRINHDRVEGYKKAKQEVDESKFDLLNVFEEMIEQSNNYIGDLGALITKYGGTIANDATIMGALYRTWMDFKLHLVFRTAKMYLAHANIAKMQPRVHIKQLWKKTILAKKPAH